MKRAVFQAAPQGHGCCSRPLGFDGTQMGRVPMYFPFVTQNIKKMWIRVKTEMKVVISTAPPRTSLRKSGHYLTASTWQQKTDFRDRPVSPLGLTLRHQQFDLSSLWQPWEWVTFFSPLTVLSLHERRLLTSRCDAGWIQAKWWIQTHLSIGPFVRQK